LLITLQVINRFFSIFVLLPAMWVKTYFVKIAILIIVLLIVDAVKGFFIQPAEAVVFKCDRIAYPVDRFGNAGNLAPGVICPFRAPAEDERSPSRGVAPG